MAEITPVASPTGDDGVDEPKSPTPTQTTSVSSSSPSSSTATVAELLQAAQSRPVSGIDDKIKELKVAREKIKQEKKALAKDLKQSERKRQRLKAKAKALSSSDLIEVLQFRSVDQTKTADKKKTAEAKASAKAKP
jgi:cell shape-determining protein MreC